MIEGLGPQLKLTHACLNLDLFFQVSYESHEKIPKEVGLSECISTSC